MKAGFEPGEQYDSCYAICPYCGSQTGDCDEWLTQEDEEHECWTCKKRYLARAEYSVDYITTPLPETKP